MDLVSALGVASATLQFVEFGSKILKLARQIYVSKDGNTAQHAEFKVQSEHLRELCNTQKKPKSFSELSPHEQKLGELCTKCDSVAAELVNLLKDLAPKKTKSAMGSISGALKVVAKDKKISSLRANLDEHQKLINSQLLVVLQ